MKFKGKKIGTLPRHGGRSGAYQDGVIDGDLITGCTGGLMCAA